MKAPIPLKLVMRNYQGDKLSLIFNRYPLSSELVELNAIIDTAVNRLPKPMDTEKCKKCERSVPHPCNTIEGFMTEGPWDTFCDGYWHPERYE